MEMRLWALLGVLGCFGLVSCEEGGGVSEEVRKQSIHEEPEPELSKKEVRSNAMGLFKRDQITMKVEGGAMAMPYGLYEPTVEGSTKGEKFPLMIFLHGAGARGNDYEKPFLRYPVAERLVAGGFQSEHPCFVLIPQCPKDEKWEGARLELFFSLLDEVLEDYPVDRDRVYLSGLSMGGKGVQNALKARSGDFAGALICSTTFDEGMEEYVAKVPVWIFYGGDEVDVVLSTSERVVGALRGMGKAPGLTVVPDIGHWSWVYAFQEGDLDWLFGKVRGGE